MPGSAAISTLCAIAYLYSYLTRAIIDSLSYGFFQQFTSCVPWNICDQVDCASVQVDRGLLEYESPVLFSNI